MAEHDLPSNDPPQSKRGWFSWTFSLGKADEWRRLLEAARATGAEPEVRQRTWQLNLPTLLRLMERHDPLRPLRRILAWVPRVLFLAIFLGGIILGYFEPSLGPIWGGIFGMVLGAFFYKMTQPPGWLR